MRIGIPIWGDKISPLLDTASRLLVVEMEEAGETSRFQIFLDEENISRRSLRIHGLHIDTLICGAISRPFLRLLLSGGIEIIPEISGNPESVLRAFLEGKLFHSRFMMPGCRRKKLYPSGQAIWTGSQVKNRRKRRRRKSKNERTNEREPG